MPEESKKTGCRRRIVIKEDLVAEDNVMVGELHMGPASGKWISEEAGNEEAQMV